MLLVAKRNKWMFDSNTLFLIFSHLPFGGNWLKGSQMIKKEDLVAGPYQKLLPSHKINSLALFKKSKRSIDYCCNGKIYF